MYSMGADQSFKIKSKNKIKASVFRIKSNLTQKAFCSKI